MAWAPCGWPINSSLPSNTPLDRAGLLCEVDDTEAAFADNRENLEWSDGVADLGSDPRWRFAAEGNRRLLIVGGEGRLRCHHTHPTR